MNWKEDRTYYVKYYSDHSDGYAIYKIAFSDDLNYMTERAFCVDGKVFDGFLSKHTPPEWGRLGSNGRCQIDALTKDDVFLEMI